MNKEGYSSNKENNERHKNWEETVKKIDRTIDKLGRPIDENIKEGIVALNLLGIHTTASCEGHLDHGTFAPYVDIESTDVVDLENKLKEATDKESARSILNEIEKKNLEERKKITFHLENFYKERQVPFNNRLVIRGLAREWSRLESQGAGLQKIEPENIREIQLLQYQDEMKQFIAFLKKEYFK